MIRIKKWYFASTILLAFNLLLIVEIIAQPSQRGLQVGAANTQEYLPLLKEKEVGLVVNQTSLVGGTHLVDTLVASGVTIKRIFAPEHGFRGDRDAGEEFGTERDRKTGLPLVSLYGKNYKPKDRHIRDLDYVIFDIQDVGVRCYTYISTLHYVMQACAENGIPLIVLDRPNPNVHYVDGPVLDLEFKSFVGVHPIPLVYGLTIGELATMVNEENWLGNDLKCDLTVISVSNYTRNTSYSLPVKPSPNLPDDQSIAFYPSLVLFEGTPISVGRGTTQPFQMIGYPNLIFGDFTFTPKSIEGMSKYPPYEEELCYGIDLRTSAPPKAVDLSYLIGFYKRSNPSWEYFNNFFDLLAGTDQLRTAIQAGQSAEEISKSWDENLQAYQLIRSKYLIYPE